MISIIAPAYMPTVPVPQLIPSLLAQRDRDWEAFVVHDGPGDEAWEAWKLFFSDDRIHFRETRERGNVWGHDIRAIVLAEEELRGRYVHITNADNILLPTAVALMNEQTATAVAWPVLHSYGAFQLLHPRLYCGGIDMCGGMVETGLAKSVGFPWRDVCADWLYWQSVAQKTSDWAFLDSTLAVHC